MLKRQQHPGSMPHVLSLLAIASAVRVSMACSGSATTQSGHLFSPMRFFVLCNTLPGPQHAAWAHVSSCNQSPGNRLINGHDNSAKYSLAWVMVRTHLDCYSCTLPGALVDSAIRACPQKGAHLHIIKGFPLELPEQMHMDSSECAVLHPSQDGCKIHAVVMPNVTTAPLSGFQVC